MVLLLIFTDKLGKEETKQANQDKNDEKVVTNAEWTDKVEQQTWIFLNPIVLTLVRIWTLHKRKQSAFEACKEEQSSRDIFHPRPYRTSTCSFPLVHE